MPYQGYPWVRSKVHLLGRISIASACVLLSAATVPGCPEHHRKGACAVATAGQGQRKGLATVLAVALDRGGGRGGGDHRGLVGGQDDPDRGGDRRGRAAVSMGSDRLVRRRSDAIAAVAGFAVLVACGLVARSGTVGAAERSVFEAINGLPDGLEPVMHQAQFLGVLAIGPLVALVALAFRRYRLAAAAALVTLFKLVGERIVWQVVDRERPGVTEPNAIVRGGTATDGVSFVSGHVVLVTGLAWVITPYLRGALAGRPVARRGAGGVRARCTWAPTTRSTSWGASALGRGDRGRRQPPGEGSRPGGRRRGAGAARPRLRRAADRMGVPSRRSPPARPRAIRIRSTSRRSS